MNVWSYLSRLITLSLQQKCYVLQVTIKTPERRQQKYYVLQVTIKTPERRQQKYYVFKVNNKDTRTTSFWCLYCNFEHIHSSA